MNETLTDILESTPPAFLEIGIDHYSPTQLNCSMANWAYKYAVLNQESRRSLKHNVKMYFGVVIGELCQLCFCDELWSFKSKVAKNKDKYSLDRALESLDAHMKKYEPYDDADKELYEGIKDTAPDMMRNAYNGWKTLNLKSPVVGERNVRLKFTYVNCLGRTDGDDKLMLIEQKCKIPQLNRPKKDGTRSVKHIALPDEEPQLSHARQTAFYHFATGKKPHLMYANAKEYKIFDPSNCQLLTKDAMEEHLEHYKRMARLRDRAIMKCNGSVRDLLRDLDPDWEHNYEWDIGEEHKLHAQKTFREAQAE
tara:strand:+ start:8582 stop:9508 length:927 start_codon:yes stop_codon:yes gene_type:complete